MATTPKVLGQLKPAAATASTLYTAGAGTAAMSSTITVCNLGPAYTTYRIAVRPGGAALEDKHYVAYDCGIGPNTTDTVSLGIGIGATDVVTVQSASGNVAFGLYGAEVS